MLDDRPLKLRRDAVGLLSLSALVLSFFFGARSASAGVMIRLSESPGQSNNSREIDQVIEAGGDVWALSNGSVYQVNGQRLVPVMMEPSASSLAEVAGKLWIGTDHGLFELRDELTEPAPMHLQALHVGDQTIQLSGEIGVGIESMTRRGGEVWIGTSDAGLLSVEVSSGWPERVVQVLDHPTKLLRVLKNDVWASTESGVFRIDSSGTLSRIQLQDSVQVEGISEAASQVWLTTTLRRRLFSIRGRGRRDDQEPAGKSQSYGPLYRVENDVAEEFRPLSDHLVVSVEEIGGEPWFATNGGGYRWHDGAIEAVDLVESGEPINAIAKLGDQLWFGGNRHVFHCGLDGCTVFPAAGTRAPDVYVLGIVLAKGKTWIRTSDGLYRYDDDVEIDARLATIPLCCSHLALGPMLHFREWGYRASDGSDPYGGVVNGFFKGIVAPTRDKLDQEIAAQTEADLSRLAGPVPPGIHDLRVHVMDRFGNARDLEIPEVIVLPRKGICWTILIIGSAIGFSLLMLILLRLSSWFRFPLGVVVALASQKWWTLGTLHVLLGRECIRRWVLERYLKEVRSHHERRATNGPQVSQDAVSDVARKLSKRRRLLVVGELPLVESTLQSLQLRMANKQKAWRLSQRAPIPIFLELGTFGESAEVLWAAVKTKLQKWGDVTDGDFADRILHDPTGMFAFILCAERDLTDEERRTVRRFVRESSPRSFIVVGASSGDHIEGNFDRVVMLNATGTKERSPRGQAVADGADGDAFSGAEPEGPGGEEE